MTPEVEAGSAAIAAVLTTLPRRIKVGAYDWRIKIDTDESEAYGEANFEKAVITLWPAVHQSPERLVGTLLHELLHVIYHNEGVDVNGDGEEGIVCSFETGLISLYRDNPKLLNWIKRGLRKNGTTAN